jgi:hypothetical protein
LITTVQGQCLSFATFLTSLLSHYPLPLTPDVGKETFFFKYEKCKSAHSRAHSAIANLQSF